MNIKPNLAKVLISLILFYISGIYFAGKICEGASFCMTSSTVLWIFDINTISYYPGIIVKSLLIGIVAFVIWSFFEKKK